MTTLWRSIESCMEADQSRLRRRLRELQSRPESDFAPLTIDIERSSALRARRLASRPAITYPDLPVAERRQEIAEAVRKHQVIILSGETGSGKTTQLPKICLEMGRGIGGMIGLTQPRRLAARAMADYLAKDLGTVTGLGVGCQIRFHDRVAAESLIKVMTDGILLAEIQSDRFFSRYDTLIIDEAHERNLNIDFLLGYLKRILPKRPTLKLIVSSATLDTEKFSRHFDHAPILQVTGRTYPVEVRYRPLVDLESTEESEPDLTTGILHAVDELAALGPNGDCLVFLPGEKEIRETAEALRQHHPPSTEILPLYARLSRGEQDRVFQLSGRRRIVLATNVAETSLTVPGIRYVVDTGLARISRYSDRSQVQRLPVAKISQAAANQRQGRCGRLSDGVCIRLYAEADFLARPRHTEPELLRSSLAAVILRMKAMELGEPGRFPFVDPPATKAIREGDRLLQELEAIDPTGRLTEIGRQLARLPIDPRLGRVILAGRDRLCLRETLIIAAFLSIQDPREWPQIKKEVAIASHNRFRDKQSDFMGILNLWQFIAEAKLEKKSRNKFQAFLKENFLSRGRVREWEEIHLQLSLQVKEAGMRPNETPAGYPEIHLALLAGFLGGIGEKLEKKEYQGTRQGRFFIHPGSGLTKSQPEWLMAAELVATSQLFARTCAKVEPEWIEQVAGSLCHRQHSEPHWSKDRGEVVVQERVVLFGLAIIPRRLIPYGPIDPVASREIFIQCALVEGEFITRAPFFHHNQALISEIEELEKKTRRRDLRVDDEFIFSFYSERIPEGIFDNRTFERFRRTAEQRNPNHLFLTKEILLRQADGLSPEDFPGHIQIEGQEFALEYQFNPGQQGDGVTLVIPLPQLGLVNQEPLWWLVPGLLRELVTAAIKSLPQGLRKHLVPVPTAVDTMLPLLTFGQDRLDLSLSKAAWRTCGVEIPAEAWQLEKIPDHLRFFYKVVDRPGGRVIEQGRDLLELQQKLLKKTRESFAELPKETFEKTRLTRWDFGPIPDQVPLTAGRIILYGYPALVDEGDTVALRLLATPAEARENMRIGLRRLFLLACGQTAKGLERSLPLTPAACLAYADLGRCELLRREIVAAAADQVFLGDETWTAIRETNAFQAKLAEGRVRLPTVAAQLARTVEDILKEYQMVRRLLAAERPVPVTADLPADDCREQLGHLIYRGFLLTTPAAWLVHLPRYLKALHLRLERRANAPLRDRQRQAQVTPFWQDYRHQAERQQANPELETFRWLVEEWRVSLFAQELRTAVPVSAKRLQEQWQVVRPR